MTANTLSLDGKTIPFNEGDSVLEVAKANGVEIPSLCFDPRLKPAGACRTCLVEVEGQRRLIPSCATVAKPGMKVSTTSTKVDKHQKLLAALYLSDNVSENQTHDTADASQLHAWAKNVNAPTDWPKLESTRFKRPNDKNPYIEFREDRCILCARCTRYCEEVEGVSAISLLGRGADTTIGTADNQSLMDTTCELCGGCIDTCPTGAMTEKLPLTQMLKPAKELTKVRTTCNYCGVGCQMDLNVDPKANQGRGKVVKVTSPPTGTAPNDGNLCVKGRFAYNFVDHPDRLSKALVKQPNGEFKETPLKEAIHIAAKGLLNVKEKYGPNALGFVSSSRCTMEENYLVQKLARAAFGTNNCHQCAAT